MICEKFAVNVPYILLSKVFCSCAGTYNSCICRWRNRQSSTPTRSFCFVNAMGQIAVAMTPFNCYVTTTMAIKYNHSFYLIDLISFVLEQEMLHLIEYKDNSFHLMECMYTSVVAKTPGIAKAPRKVNTFLIRL